MGVWKRLLTLFLAAALFCSFALSGAALDIAPEANAASPLKLDYNDDVWNVHRVVGGEAHIMDGDQRQSLVDALNDRVGQPVRYRMVGTPLQGRFLVTLQDRTKYIYTVYEDNVVQVTAQYFKDGAASSESQYYEVTPTAHATLKGLLASDESYFAHVPYWLAYMNPTRVVNVEYSMRGETAAGVPGDHISQALVSLGGLSIIPGETKRYNQVENKSWNLEKLRVKLSFDGGVVYTLTFVGDNTLYLESSDIDTYYRYTMRFDNEWQAVKDMLTNENVNPTTGKPVIYLYPEQPREVSVKLDFKGRIAYTFPAYNGGWKVLAQPDGTLTNLADNSTHYYLFWDGFADKQDWDFSSGFVIAGADTEAFLKEKLPLLGLTPREYNDFITYWVPELSRNRYNLITFATQEYEEIAPLSISPQPDSILRVHMVFKALSEPVDIPEQKLPVPPSRNGFTVVEWGGTRA